MSCCNAASFFELPHKVMLVIITAKLCNLLYPHSPASMLLTVKTPAVFYIDGKEIHTKTDSYIIFPLHAPLHYTADGGEYIDDWLHFFPDEEDLRLFKELDISRPESRYSCPRCLSRMCHYR